ncbi:MAG: PEP-CTERM sorting domain-containing protein [Rhodospirillaceae bacterium]|jgi:hypothetical protein|nr:PEP-CTERM sorting domain-containing protein [Rhodospirillaceae bacterium]
MKNVTLFAFAILILMTPRLASSSVIDLQVDLSGFVGTGHTSIVINNVQGTLVGNPLDTDFTLNVSISGLEHIEVLGGHADTLVGGIRVNTLLPGTEGDLGVGGTQQFGAFFDDFFSPVGIKTAGNIDSGNAGGDAIQLLMENPPLGGSVIGYFDSWSQEAFTSDVSGLVDLNPSILGIVTISTAFGSGTFNVVSELAVGVPEPPSFSILGIGLAGLAAMRRSRTGGPLLRR